MESVKSVYSSRIEVFIMKRILSIILVLVLAGTCLTGCGSGQKTGSENVTESKEISKSGEGDSLEIVTTIFPEYDWVKNLLGENPAGANLTMLLDKGVDLHSFQPTAEDMLKIANCDLFIYVGGESDEWVEDALKEAVNKDMVAINLLDSLGDSVREEEIVEGMQEEEEAEEGSEDTAVQENSEEKEEEPEYDEHVWLSFRNAEVLCDVIAKALADIDPDHADLYAANASGYIEKLKALDVEYEEAAAEGSRKTLLFGDRFPFRYLTDDYGLDYYAAFAGCSAETEASFETITFLSGKVDELELPCVMTIEGTDHRIAETIIDNTSSKDQKILVLDSMQSTGSEDVSAGVTYLSIMEHNLEALREALK